MKFLALKVTVAGSHALPNKNLVAMIAVGPFGTYSLLLKDLSLFGHFNNQGTEGSQDRVL